MARNSAQADDANRIAPAVSHSGDTPPGGSLAASDTSRISLPQSLGEVSPLPQLKQYRLLELVGRGGMGDVYRAHDTLLDRVVAIKVLSPDLARDETFVHRFQREAKAVASLSHPHIIPVYEIDHDQGFLFFSMQFVEGETLERRLRRQGRLSLFESVRIITDCLSALKLAHEYGLIHRDVKPGNVLLQNETNHVYVADFGLVRRIDDQSLLTVTGMVMGTVDYMAPEQARGTKQIDARTDLYSIGAMFYHLLAGRLPFESQSFTSMLYSHAYERPFPLEQCAPELPPQVVKLIDRLMAKKPADRPANCREVIDALTPLQSASFRAKYVTEQLEEVGHSAQPSAEFAHLPEVYTPWQRAYDRLATLIHQRSPQWLQQCQTLEQQVEGEVARALRQRQRLQALHDEGRQLWLELDQQRNAAPTPDEELDLRFAQLTEQLAQLEVQLVQAGARHAQLVNRRDALAARVALSSRVPSSSRRKFALLAVASAALVGALCLKPLQLTGWLPPESEKLFEVKQVANRLEAGEWHDLMPDIDPTRDTVAGHWFKDNQGVLLAEGGASYSGHARLQVPVCPQGDYELEATISRRDSDVNLVFPVGEYSARACFGHHQIEGGLVSHYPQPDRALGMVDAVTPMHQGDPPRTVRVIVHSRQDQVTVKIYVEKTLTCDWTGPCRDLANNIPCQIPDARALGLTISQKSASFHSLRLRMISGYADLTPPPLTPAGQLQFGLAAHYKFDEGQGLDLHDRANHVDGRLMGAKWTKGFDDGALYFDGDDYVRIPQSLLNHQANYTFTGWVRDEGSLGQFHIYADHSDDWINSSIRLNKSTMHTAIWTPTRWHGNSTPAGSAIFGQWHFIAARFTATDNKEGIMTVWIDGQSYQYPLPILDADKANNARIGWSGRGSIEDLRIYHRSLSDGEVAAIRELHAAKAAAANRKSKAEFALPEGGPVIQSIYHQPRSHFDAAIADNPTNAAAYRQRSHWYAVRQQWPEARADLEAYLNRAAGDVTDLESVAAYCLHASDLAAYNRHASVILAQLPGKTNGGSIAGFLRILLLSRELDEATLELCEATDKQLQQLPPKHYTYISEPLLLYRQGKWQACIDSATQHFPAGAKHPIFYLPLFYRAMALHQLGDRTKAKEELEAIQNHLEALTLATAGYSDGSPEQRMIWWCSDSLLCQIAYREASELILDERRELKVKPEIDPRAESVMSLPEQSLSKLRYEPVGAKFPPDYQAGQQDYALSFDGTAHLDLPLWYDGSHPISFEAFVTPLATNTYGTVIANFHLSGLGLDINGMPRRWQFVANDGIGTDRGYQKAIADQPIQALRRVHVAGVFDGTRLRLFIDGKLQSTVATVHGLKSSSLPFFIGADPTPNSKPEHFFNGMIDEVRISRSVRYTEDFTPAKRLEPDEDTLALYHFDEGAGNRLNDSSGHGFHGTIQNAKWVRADAIPVAQKPKEFADTKNPSSDTQSAVEANRLELAGELAWSNERIDALVSANPNKISALQQRYYWNVIRFRWPEARADLDRIIPMQPTQPTDLYLRSDLAAICLFLGDSEAHAAHCEVLENRLSEEPVDWKVYFAAMSLSLSDAEEIDYPKVRMIATRRLMRLDRDLRRYLPLAHYRCGEWQACLEAADTYAPKGPVKMSDTVPWLFRAMALYRLDQVDEARASLTDIKKFAEAQRGPYAWRKQHFESFFIEALYSQIVYREASELILGHREELQFVPVNFSSAQAETGKS